MSVSTFFFGMTSILHSMLMILALLSFIIVLLLSS